MITTLIIFSLLIEYVYDPISMKDTYAINFLIEKYKNYFKDFSITNILSTYCFQF